MRGSSILALLALGAAGGYYVNTLVEDDRARVGVPFVSTEAAPAASSAPSDLVAPGPSNAPNRIFAARRPLEPSVDAAPASSPPLAPVAPITLGASSRDVGFAPQAEPILVAETRVVSRKRIAGADRAGLVRDLQNELRRVGCYSGEVTGEWSPATRRAMKSFVDWVNARLPVEEPDHILLTLAQGQLGRACGAGCPSGEVAAADGKCMPQLVTAKGPALNRPLASTVVPTPARRPSAVEVGGIQTGGLQAGAVAAAPVDALGQRAYRPLDGRMSVGGPVAQPYQVAPSLSGVAPPIAAAVPQGAPLPAATASLGASDDDSRGETAGNGASNGNGASVAPRPRPRPARADTYTPAPRRKTLNDPREARQLFFGPGGG